MNIPEITLGNYNEVFANANPLFVEYKSKNGFSLCIHALLNLSKITSYTTNILIEVLQNNNSSQQQLNIELEETSLLPVPTLEKKPDDTYKNQFLVQSIQASNQQVTSQRQQIQQDLAFVQQQSQISQTNVNTNISTSLQIIQTTNSLLRTLEEITFNANLARPPRT